MHSNPPQAPDYANHGHRGAKPGIVLLWVPLGAVAGFVVAILLEMVVGIFAGAIYSASNPGDPGAFMWLASLPGWGSIAGAVIAPVLYVLFASRRGAK
ncbi:hypothetical protein [Arthrobacter pigmenti]